MPYYAHEARGPDFEQLTVDRKRVLVAGLVCAACHGVEGFFFSLKARYAGRH